MSTHIPPKHLTTDVALERQAHGRNTTAPCGVESKLRIIQQEKARLEAMSDDEFFAAVDKGAIHLRVMARLVGRKRAFTDYETAHKALVATLNNKGPGAASEIVSGILLQRAGLPVQWRSSVADLAVGESSVEVKSSFEGAFRNAKKGHQVAINRKQLGHSNFLLVNLITGRGARKGSVTETSLQWVLAPMPVVADHVNKRLSGQAANEEITVHFRPATARETFKDFTYGSSRQLTADLRTLLS